MHSLFSIVLLFAVSVVAAAQQPTVTVLNGTIQGARCPSSNVNSFFSIPFANPPVGDLRFAPPQPYNQKFDGVLDATKAAPACPQFNADFNETTPESEDCLFIDVWAPANATAGSKLPVRFWIFGGANEAGGISDALYDGCFASTNSIQVSVNYRVGPLGFLVDESLGLRGNYGIQDQLLGLQWVQENIASFGGDPTRVMLFGQSAGAEDSRIIAGLPQAKTLMHSVVLESGGYGGLPDLATASRANAPYIKSLNCSTSDLACLRSTPVQSLVTEFINNPPPDDDSQYVIDGTTIPSAPTHPLVPSIIGSTGAEGTLFILGLYGKQSLSLNESDYISFLESNFHASQVASINETYPLSLFAAAPVPALDAISTIYTYAYFRCPASQVAASAVAAGLPVWTYSFNHTPSCPWYQGIQQSDLEILGATHTSELPFVFDQVADMPRPNGHCDMTADEVSLSATMRGYWDRMAAGAAPGGNWPAYNTSASMGVNVLESTEWQVGVVDYSMCDFWDTIIGSVVGGTNGSSSSGGGGSGSTTAPVNGSAMNAVPTWRASIGAAFCILALFLTI